MDILNGNFAVAAVLISFGGLIGKIGPTQVLVVTLVELVFYCANKVFFLTNMMEISDCGGTIIIHVFGAYFGLAACKTLGRAKDENFNGSSYNSDLFSLIGTVFLWLFWPSFVAGGLPAGTDGHGIALLNTVLALLASSVTTFALMPFLTGKRLTTVPIQNATLAGGVSIGATANLAMGPFGAMLVGVIAGAISCIGFCKPLIASDCDMWHQQSTWHARYLWRHCLSSYSFPRDGHRGGRGESGHWLGWDTCSCRDHGCVDRLHFEDDRWSQPSFP